MLFVTFLGTNVQAQNKTKDVRTEVKSDKIEKQVVAENDQDARIEETFKRALDQAKTDQERKMIEQKKTAYYQSKEKKSKDNALVSNKQELKKELSVETKNAQIKNAYQETYEVERKLEESNLKIKAAKDRLESAKKSQSLSAEEIAVKEAKLIEADKKLKEAKMALERERSVIIEKHKALESED